MRHSFSSLLRLTLIWAVGYALPASDAHAYAPGPSSVSRRPYAQPSNRLTLSPVEALAPDCLPFTATFAREFLPKDAGVIHFVNADLIAGGLSPLRPEIAAVAAGRLFLAELDRLARARMDFAFETTLSGLIYLARLRRWKSAGYRIEIVYLRLSSPRLALRRVASRVRQGVRTQKPTKTFSATVGCALRRAGKVARKTARAYGTPVFYWRDGKVVSEKP